MTAASKSMSPRKLPCGGIFARRTRLLWGETGVLGEGTDVCSRGARRGRGPSTCARIAEITSGRAISQQGLATTCKDPARNGRTGGAGRGMVWRMSPYERRRGGNALPGGSRGRPSAGNTRPGQRGSGHSVATTMGTQPDAELEFCEACVVAKGRRKLHGVGAKSAPALQFRVVGGRPALRNVVESRGQNRIREIRPSGIVGGRWETWPCKGARPERERRHVPPRCARSTSIPTDPRWPRVMRWRSWGRR
jgi:hypothetical protein